MLTTIYAKTDIDLACIYIILNLPIWKLHTPSSYWILIGFFKCKVHIGLSPYNFPYHYWLCLDLLLVCGSISQSTELIEGFAEGAVHKRRRNSIGHLWYPPPPCRNFDPDLSNFLQHRNFRPPFPLKYLYGWPKGGDNTKKFKANSSFSCLSNVNECNITFKSRKNVSPTCKHPKHGELPWNNSLFRLDMYASTDLAK